MFAKENHSSSSPSKNRLLALDGLRGFAALSVAISHLGFSLHRFTDSTVANALFRVVSAGPSSVQLFFVLSGFLMAFLYPEIKNKTTYLKKRYLRIMPIFGVVVVSLWITFTYAYSLPPLVGVAVLLAVAFLVSGIWKGMIRVHKKVPTLGKIIFWGFLFFQVVWFGISLSTSFGFTQSFFSSLNGYQRSFFVMLSNLSMMMYWQKDLVVLEGVFWSLVPEMFFYVMYPFLLTPLLGLSRHLKPIWNGVLVVAVIILLFQIDLGSRNMFSLHGLFLSRGTGFVMGMVLGMMYHNKKQAWQVLQTWLKNPLINGLLFISFFVAIAWEWPDRYHQIRQFVMLHYLGLSVIFSLVLASALIPGSLVERFFRKKVFVFLGMVSYSLYLTHSFVMERIGQSQLVFVFESFFSEKIFLLFQASISLLGAIVVARILYGLIENMYFTHKEVFVTTQKNSRVSFFGKISPFLHAQLGWGVPVITALACVLFYSTDTVPTILLSREPIPNQAKHVSKDTPLTLSFTAPYDSFSAVLLDMDYAHDPALESIDGENSAQLVFELRDENDTVLVHSVRNPKELEGEPSFPFGFPTETSSKGKKYELTLQLENANESDEIYLYPQAGILTQSTTQTLPGGIQKYFLLLRERLFFAVQYFSTLFSLSFIAVISFLVWVSHRSFSKKHAFPA